MEKKALPWFGATWPKFLLSRLSFPRSSQEAGYGHPTVESKVEAPKFVQSWGIDYLAHLKNIEQYASWKARPDDHTSQWDLCSVGDRTSQGSVMFPSTSDIMTAAKPMGIWGLNKVCEPMGGSLNEWKKFLWFNFTHRKYKILNRIDGRHISFLLVLEWRRQPQNAMGRINIESGLPFWVYFWQDPGWYACRGPRIKELVLRQLLKGTTTYSSKWPTYELNK